ncbi:Phage tail protein [Sulfidibacter corallicola]|uniref:Phage tail protein n=1 Tax=Sulfidibacter corallicola TaxID=2818388 RepID=A0A8A4TUQ1_SULCO|nr:tail fiber protein [Sulfidibacter corallicola]QTD50255.1 phage tail protein [Sulfidibacter corallicola]
MGEPFLGEIRSFGFNFAPKGWALCNGALLPISNNQALYSLIGTQFGGDGRTTMGLPDLRGRAPIHHYPPAGVVVGNTIGSETVTLTQAQMPAHTHAFYAANETADQFAITSTRTLAISGENAYNTAAANLVTMAGDSLSNAGGGQEHNNMQPSIVVNFCIALTGYYPQRP